MEISKLFYHGDPESVDNFPLVEIRCYVLLPELCVIWCDYSYLVIIGHHRVVDVTVTLDMELFDVFVASNLISSPSGRLSISELLFYRARFTRAHGTHHRTMIELERHIQSACDSAPIDGIGRMGDSFMTMCEDLASSIMRAEYYQCALASCDRRLDHALQNRLPPRPPRSIKPTSSSSNDRRSILSLPNEVLMEIFLRSLVEFPSHDLRSPPVSLSQVCSLWRRLALGMPELWNRMSLDIALRGYPGYDATIRGRGVDPYSHLQMAMDMWACRAIQQPLHWRLVIDGTLQPMSESFKDAFFSHCPSIQSLDAYFASLRDFDALLRTHVVFQNLSSLRISCVENEEDPFSHLDLASRAPQLTDLTLAFRFYTSLDGVHDFIRFSSVTHLDLLRTAMASSLVFDILKSCTNLREGAFHTYSSEVSDEGSHMVVQDKLRSLTILANPQDMNSFPKIEYPSLERLHYAPSDQPIWIDNPTFYQFRHIRHLTLVDFEIDGAQFWTATLFFTKVESLVLRFRCGSELALLQRFFCALMDVSRETNYLPELSSLVLQRCKNFPVSDFVKMVSRRARMPTGDVQRVGILKSVALHFKHHCNASEFLVRLIDNRKIRGISFILEVNSDKYCRPVSETGVL